tara:strand:+ start:740 stop:1015 length:276 start_codon:yes stop_codon:yes gene_type:complete
MTRVKIAMATAPHLIGKHPQHVVSTVFSVEQTQKQQQHSALTGGEYGSSSSSTSSFFSDAFLDSDFGLLFSEAFLEPAPLAAGAASPPSSR